MWASKIGVEETGLIVKRLKAEMIGHENEHQLDLDLAYGVDVMKRILSGDIVDDLPQETREQKAS